MKTTNIVDLKNNINQFFSFVENGEEIEVQRKNIPIARIVPVQKTKKNSTKLGCGKGSVKYHTDLTEPLIPTKDWDMISSDETNP